MTSMLLIDRVLVELVDALVAAIDVERSEAVDRLREALEPFGATEMLNRELRLNAVSSINLYDGDCICGAWS